MEIPPSPYHEIPSEAFLIPILWPTLSTGMKHKHGGGQRSRFMAPAWKYRSIYGESIHIKHLTRHKSWEISLSLSALQMLGPWELKEGEV